MQFLFGVWFHKPDQLEVRNSLMQQIKESFEAEGIEFAYPARALYGVAPPPAPGAAPPPAPRAAAPSRRRGGGRKA